ncbi:MAG: hypothetical protein IPL39_01970 [Opitutaceae bacterium]|nr:hypothetical protein [Opitutaceae bacterium]
MNRNSNSWWSLPVLAMLACLVGCPGGRTAQEAPAAAPVVLSVSAGGIVARAANADRSVVPSAQPDRPLQAGDTMVVSFAQPMVVPSALDQPVEMPPVEFQPALPFRFEWKSPAEGEVIATGTPAPATGYRLRLRAGLRDAAGQAVDSPAWGVQWPEALFVVGKSAEYDSWPRFSDSLPARPTLALEFSHPVAAAEVARTVYWRDEEGRLTGSDVRLEAAAEAKAAIRFAVTPRQPLAAGHRYELLVEGTENAVDASRLSYVHVFPVGRTEPLLIETVAGLNQPRLGAFIEVRCNQMIDPASVTPAAVAVTPAVADARLEVDGAVLRLFGAFDTAVRYRVGIAGEIRSRRGFQLAGPERWQARFQGKRAAVVMPRSIVTTTARQGLTLDLVQVNTGRLHWNLARVPDELMLTVRRRLDEYRGLDRGRRDPVTGEWKQLATELLVPALGLPVVAQGDFEAVDGDREVERSVALASGVCPEGIYLFEIAGTTNDARLAGNRALVLVNREFLVWKMTASALRARLFDVVSGEAVAHAGVQIRAADGAELGRGETDEAGDVELPRLRGDEAPELVVVTRGGNRSAHFVDLTGGLPRSWRQDADEEEVADTAATPELRQWLFSDRGIYRPGETLKAKGIVRQVRDGRLTLPEVGTAVPWQLARTSQGEAVAAGETALSAAGSWETEIALPASLPVGHYVLRALGTSCWVKIDEFRAPAFAAEAVTLAPITAGENRVRVMSRYFHGAANARAAVRWRAIWMPHTPDVSEGEAEPGLWWRTRDYEAPERELRRPRQLREVSEAEPEEVGSRVFEGTAVLDAQGVVELSSRQPFPASRCLAAAAVRWEISVIAPDGQTVDVGNDAVLPVARAQPAVALKAAVGAREVEVIATAVDVAGSPVAGVPLKVELYRVAEKSAREKVSRHVVRYRNTPVFTLVGTREVPAPFRGTFPVEGTGRFVAVVSLAGAADSPRASGEVTVVGEAPAEFAQWDDSTFEVRPDLSEYPVGATAHLALRAPFAGQVWVTVETDRLLYSKQVSLSGNAASVDVPVTAEMHPNAHVEVYLFRPEALGAPAERLGRCDLRVRRPETELQVRTEVAAPKVEPGDTVTGTVTVEAEGRPAAEAEVTLFAVDEAVLRYGEWALGDAGAVFFPAAAHAVETRSSLRQFGPRAPDDPLFQKGFLLGDGGGPAAAVRRHFAVLAFWQGNLRTDQAGKAEFAFTAPDNLTAYRIVAVAHRGTEQFGHGAQLVEVARRLQAEPALPRFVRAGDEVDLRVIVRENEWPQLRSRVECRVAGAMLLGESRVEFDLEQGIPAPVVFRARVLDGAVPLGVRFTVQALGGEASRDAVEVTLPVLAARVLRRETVAGKFPTGGTEGWEPGAALPAEWQRGKGTVDVVVSRSPWLPLFDGLPRLLDYPHGCDEQISARVLAYGLMADLLEALPDAEARRPEYRRRVEEGLALLARAQLPNGEIPYWPGTRVGNPFVTIQTAWAAVEAERSGFKVSRYFLESVQEALTRMARREDGVRVEPTLRAFAVMVSAALNPARKLRGEALELYQQRDALDDDGRAFLALAMHRFGIMAEEKRQLVAELGTAAPERVFTPGLLGSAARTEALRLYAQSEIAGGSWTAAAREAQRKRVHELMAASTNFSTQENLWLLLAFRAFVKGEGGEGIGPGLLAGTDSLRSPDGRAAGWYGVPLKAWTETLEGPTGTVGGTGSFLLRGAYQLPEPERRLDRGFRLERIVRNLTDAKRDGSGAAPFALGDELLVTFRVFTERAQAYVALEESLPAAVETVDPEYLRLTLREKTGEAAEGGLRLSHWEKRDDRTLWYFDSVEPGTLAHSVVVRVTTSGSFQWPGAVISPMYDHRFSGMSEGTTIEVR